MANRLKMAMVDTVQRLLEQGWWYRRIARELGIHRDTVAGLAGKSKPAKAPLGADPLGQAVATLDAQATEALSVVSSSSASCLHSSQEKGQVDGSAAGGDSRSACEPFRSVILSKLELGLSGQRIYQDLISDHAFPGSYYSVRRFVQHLGQTRELPFRRLECAPGEEVQVDFGTGIPITQADGRRWRTHVFRVVLSYSRNAYSEGVADTRLHGTTRQQVGKVFREVEQACLQPLPLARFPFFHEGQRSVHRDGHVEVAKAYYSVPPEYVSRRVWARWDGQVVRVFNQRLEQTALHVQREPGRVSTHAQHLAAAKISGIERGATWLLTKVGHIGPQTRQWAQAML